mmetsp:Transcript_55955/g.104997  ORF Transcript_55955/g.104997 Transcript_55955/m.104997 type:complete len:134 (+) Transcript_55955:1595-1996(+)
MGQLAQKKPCYCEHGLPGICVNRTSFCDKCWHGYSLSNGTCHANTCTCENGQPAVGQNCSVDSGHACSRCYEGYYLQDDLCMPKQCTCQNGQAASGEACGMIGMAACVSCNHGFRLENSTRTCSPVVDEESIA